MKNMIKAIMSSMLVLTIVIGQGIAANSSPQGKMMARRAAIIDIQKQTNGAAGMSIISEHFDGQTYTIEAEF